MSNIGKLFVDTTVGRTYAVGATGFIDMHTGDFIPYDSAFEGPEFFDKQEFEEARL